jgi:BirA family biotin operon repressor/biotin-[acetyl-CoA-carboxylase] ligase
MDERQLSPNDVNSYRIGDLERHPWLRAVRYFPSLASTNDWALRNGAEPFSTDAVNSACVGGGDDIRSRLRDPVGMVNETDLVTRPILVLTGEQTAGRGRDANRWWSATGSLTFSLILQLPDWLPPSRRSELALVAGLAVRHAVAAHTGGPAHVKWPNDVYVGERKIAGILIETAANWPPRIVVGIGLNVNNSLAEAPPDVRARATSIIDILTGQLSDRTGVLLSLLEAMRTEIFHWLNAAYLSIADASNSSEATELATTQWIAERWNPHCFLSGRTVRIESAGRVLIGRCLGVSNAGELQVLTETGVVTCRSGVVASFDSL